MSVASQYVQRIEEANKRADELRRAVDQLRGEPPVFLSSSTRPANFAAGAPQEPVFGAEVSPSGEFHTWGRLPHEEVPRLAAWLAETFGPFPPEAGDLC